MSKEHEKIQGIFMKCYEDHSDAILRYCHFQTSNREVAVDLVQDTFMKTWGYLSDGKEIDENEDDMEKFDKEFVISQLDKLDPDSREMLTMRYINEMSIKEISEATELTPNNVSVKIHRSIEKMKDVLKEYYEL